MPELLKSGRHRHLISDHSINGSTRATYHNRYSPGTCARGQEASLEGERWRAAHSGSTAFHKNKPEAAFRYGVMTGRTANTSSRKLISPDESFDAARF